MQRWFDNLDVLERLAKDVGMYLSRIQGAGRPLAMKHRFESLSWRESLAHYGVATRLWFCPFDLESFYSALKDDRDRPFLGGPQGQAFRDQLWVDIISKDRTMRLVSASALRTMVAAIKPASGAGRPTDWDSRRIRILYRVHRRVCSRIYRLRDRFVTPPPAELLPVIETRDRGPMTVMDRAWVAAAPTVFLSAYLDASPDAVDYHIKRGRARVG